LTPVTRKKLVVVVLSLLAVLAPWLLPEFQNQLAVLWVMVILSLCWDIMGGQMGYNSFGSIIFFGTGMYATTVVQRGFFASAEEYTSALSSAATDITASGYLGTFALGLLVGALLCIILALILGAAVLQLRGHYFAICTLGLGIAAGEIASGIDFLGAGSGLTPIAMPGNLGERGLFFYYYFLMLAVLLLLTLRFLYRCRFGLVINAIRDNEDKAEAMGLRTTLYKTVAWSVSAVFLALAGGAYGNFIGFIDPIDVAFSGSTLGVWMILMAILGGKGTLWGPVLGAFVFHITQELFWAYLLGWQRVALGLLIVLIVLFFPQGLMGWMRERWGVTDLSGRSKNDPGQTEQGHG